VKRHDHLDLAMRKLEQHGIKPRLSTTNGSHIKLEWSVNGRQQFTITGATPSDRFVRFRVLTDVRRQLQQAGVVEKCDA
jgi:hypothetical protein